MAEDIAALSPWVPDWREHPSDHTLASYAHFKDVKAISADDGRLRIRCHHICRVGDINLCSEDDWEFHVTRMFSHRDKAFSDFVGTVAGRYSSGPGREGMGIHWNDCVATLAPQSNIWLALRETGDTYKLISELGCQYVTGDEGNLDGNIEDDEGDPPKNKASPEIMASYFSNGYTEIILS